MDSLISSKLYGVNGDVVDCSGSTNCPDGLYPGTTCPTTVAGVTCVGAWTSTAGTRAGPDKNNFIGFGQEVCGGSATPTVDFIHIMCSS